MRIERKISLYQKKISIFENTARKGLQKACWGSNKHAKDPGSRVSATGLFRSYRHFVMAYAYGYSELHSTVDKERSKSQKGRSDFSSMSSVSVVQTLEMKSVLT